MTSSSVSWHSRFRASTQLNLSPEHIHTKMEQQNTQVDYSNQQTKKDSWWTERPYWSIKRCQRKQTVTWCTERVTMVAVGQVCLPFAYTVTAEWSALWTWLKWGYLWPYLAHYVHSQLHWEMWTKLPLKWGHLLQSGHFKLGKAIKDFADFWG